MSAKVKVTYLRCFISVRGMDFRCPVCGTLVKSGDSHGCEKVKERNAVKKGKGG